VSLSDEAIRADERERSERETRKAGAPVPPGISIDGERASIVLPEGADLGDLWRIVYVYDIVDAIKSRYRTQLHTPSGQLALKLARIIDGGKPDGSVASEARELRQVLLTLDAVVAANDEEDDPVSRARRRHHGG
jgi:hypothetical protein